MGHFNHLASLRQIILSKTYYFVVSGKYSVVSQSLHSVITRVEVVKYVTTEVWPPSYLVVVAGQTVVVVRTTVVEVLPLSFQRLSRPEAQTAVARASKAKIAFIFVSGGGRWQERSTKYVLDEKSESVV